MRRWLFHAGVMVALAGAGFIAWAATVWAWQDPATLLYQRHAQGQLTKQLDARRGTRSAGGLSAVSRRYKKALREGDAVGRLIVPRLDLNQVVVEGTDTASLRRGPGHERSTSLPGEGELIYIAGHRTTYGAPFSRIDQLRKGDTIRFEMPYGTFVYKVTGSRIVDQHATGELRKRRRELLALQACYPRFSASQRYIVYANPVATETR